MEHHQLADALDNLVQSPHQLQAMLNDLSLQFPPDASHAYLVARLLLHAPTSSLLRLANISSSRLPLDSSRPPPQNGPVLAHATAGALVQFSSGQAVGGTPSGFQGFLHLPGRDAAIECLLQAASAAMPAAPAQDRHILLHINDPAATHVTALEWAVVRLWPRCSGSNGGRGRCGHHRHHSVLL